LRFGAGAAQIEICGFARWFTHSRDLEYATAVPKEHIEAQLHAGPLALAFEKHLSYSVFAAH
jgi:hypothetical protein